MNAVDFAEKVLDIKLLEYQKKLLEELTKKRTEEVSGSTMNRAARRKYMKNVKSQQVYICERCGNKVVLIDMKDGRGDVLMSKIDTPEEMCNECRELYVEVIKAKNGVE